jgi:hypothetical protein
VALPEREERELSNRGEERRENQVREEKSSG